MLDEDIIEADIVQPPFKINYFFCCKQIPALSKVKIERVCITIVNTYRFTLTPVMLHNTKTNDLSNYTTSNFIKKYIFLDLKSRNGIRLELVQNCFTTGVLTLSVLVDNYRAITELGHYFFVGELLLKAFILISN